MVKTAKCIPGTGQEMSGLPEQVKCLTKMVTQGKDCPPGPSRLEAGVHLPQMVTQEEDQEGPPGPLMMEVVTCQPGACVYNWTQQAVAGHAASWTLEAAARQSIGWTSKTGARQTTG